jgi:hypothetical protein
MGSGAKAIETQSLALTSDLQRTPPDKAGAEQWSKRLVTAIFAERERITRIDNYCRREAAITRITGEERTIAEVLPAAQTIGADAASMAQPWNADAFTHAHTLNASTDFINPTDDFMTGDNGKLRVWQLAIDDM